jgi:hypothetical protein
VAGHTQEMPWRQCQGEKDGPGLATGELAANRVAWSKEPPAFVLFWWDWGLNSWLHACKALLLEPHLESILLWLFWRWSLVNYLPGLALNLDLPISASQVSRTSVSHGCLCSLKGSIQQIPYALPSWLSLSTLTRTGQDGCNPSSQQE